MEDRTVLTLVVVVILILYVGSEGLTYLIGWISWKLRNRKDDTPD